MRHISIEDPAEIRLQGAAKAKSFAPPAWVLGEVANHLGRQDSVLVFSSDNSYAPFCRRVGGHYAQFEDGKAAFHDYGTMPMWVIEPSCDTLLTDSILRRAGVPSLLKLIVVDIDLARKGIPGLLSYLAGQQMRHVSVVWADGEPARLQQHPARHQ
jgi:hypothetical protein